MITRACRAPILAARFPVAILIVRRALILPGLSPSFRL
jgi:hypothetical protein